MTTKPSTSRIDRLIRELETHAEAQSIFDSHVDYLKCLAPTVPFGTLKSREIAAPAGSTLDYIAALKIVRKKIRGD